MFFNKKTLLAAALVTAMTGSAFAYPGHRHNRNRYVYTTPVTTYRSYPVYDSNYYNYNDRNVYKTNNSSYSRYPSRNYNSYNLRSNNGYYNQRYYNDGYNRSGYYNNQGPSLQLGPLRINL